MPLSIEAALDAEPLQMKFYRGRWNLELSLKIGAVNSFTFLVFQTISDGELTKPNL